MVRHHLWSCANERRHRHLINQHTHLLAKSCLLTWFDVLFVAAARLRHNSITIGVRIDESNSIAVILLQDEHVGLNERIQIKLNVRTNFRSCLFLLFFVVSWFSFHCIDVDVRKRKNTIWRSVQISGTSWIPSAAFGNISRIWIILCIVSSLSRICSWMSIFRSQVCGFRKQRLIRKFQISIKLKTTKRIKHVT